MTQKIFGMFLCMGLAGGLLVPVLSEDPEQLTDGVDSFNQGALQEAFRVLQDNFIRPEDLGALEVNRAALGGLVDRLPGVYLDELGNEGSQVASVTVKERLRPEVSYLRLSLREGAVPSAEQLKALTERAELLLLDLRQAGSSDSFAQAAAFLDYFYPAGTLLFQVKRPDEGRGLLYSSSEEPLDLPPLVVLIDEESSAASEVVAACLEEKEGAVLLTMGAATRGDTVTYAIARLTEEWQIRYAEAEVILASGRRPYGSGVIPEIEISSNLEGKRAAFRRAEKVGVRATIEEIPRPRFNEAALIEGTNPELPFLIERAEKRGRGGNVAGGGEADEAMDKVLQQVIDFLVATQRLGYGLSPNEH